MTSLHLFTVTTDEEKTKFLRESADLFSVKINFIKPSAYESNMDKIQEMQKAIKEIPDDDIICFVDAFDVLINGFEKEIIEKFKEFDSNLLFSAELNCYPGIFLSKMNRLYRFLNSNIQYRYLNSGGYIGYKFAIAEALSWNTENDYNGSDQGYFMDYFLNHYKIHKKIKLDHYCRIFQTMAYVNWNELSFFNGKMQNDIMNSTPCFVHFSGKSYETIDSQNIMPIFFKKMIESQNGRRLTIDKEYKSSKKFRKQK